MFTVALVSIVIYIPLYWFEPNDSLRYSGLILQLLGLITAALGIKDTRKKFGHPSLLDSLWNIVRSMIPAIKNDKVEVNRIDSHLSMSDYSCVRIKAGENSSLERRVKTLEDNFNQTYNQLNEFQYEVKNELSNVSMGLEKEKTESNKRYKYLDKKIELVSTDGLHLATVGVVWLFIGILLSTIPSEIYFIWASIKSLM